MDIARDVVEVWVIVDLRRQVATLEYGSSAVIFFIEIHAVGSEDTLNERWKCPLVGVLIKK